MILDFLKRKTLVIKISHNDKVNDFDKQSLDRAVRSELSSILSKALVMEAGENKAYFKEMALERLRNSYSYDIAGIIENVMTSFIRTHMEDELLKLIRKSFDDLKNGDTVDKLMNEFISKRFKDFIESDKNGY